MQVAAAHVPELVGGSADLAPSTLTLIDGRRRRRARATTAGATCTSASASTAMGAIVNGLALTGLRAYGATFLIFSDYMKGAVRLAALMELPSHLRLHARLDRARRGRPDPPADRATRGAARDAEHQRRAPGGRATRRRSRGASRCARRETPTALALSRQALPVLDPRCDPRRRDRARRLRPARQRRRSRELVLIGTGSEVSLCVAAADELARRRDRRARRLDAVHGPLRASRPRSERDAVLGAARHRARRGRGGEPARLGPLGRRARRVHRDADVRRLRRPRPTSIAHFGITAAAVVEQARDLLASDAERTSPWQAHRTPCNAQHGRAGRGRAPRPGSTRSAAG